MNLIQRILNLWKMSANPNNDLLYYREGPKKGAKAEFIVSDRVKEIMERKKNPTLDEVITKR